MMLDEWLDEIDTCKGARLWIAQRHDQSPRGLVLACPRGDWLLYAAKTLGLPLKDMEAAVRPSVLRALREHAPAALDMAGLIKPAQRLRELPDDVPSSTALRTAWVAITAAQKAWIECLGAAQKERTAMASRAARVASSAQGAASLAAEWAARAAEWAARAAAPDQEAEHKRCADEVRAAIGEQLIAALEAQIRNGR